MTAKGSTVEDDTHRRNSYIEHRIAGIAPSAAARLAGFKDAKTSAKNMEASPDVREIIAASITNGRLESTYTREKVLDVVDRAINMAEITADPMAMIRGAQEINKMQGHYAPETKEIILSTDAQKQKSQISEMSEQDLLDQLGRQDAYIDAEFEVLEVIDEDATVDKL